MGGADSLKPPALLGTQVSGEVWSGDEGSTHACQSCLTPGFTVSFFLFFFFLFMAELGLPCGVRASQCGGFSCCGARALGAGFSSCDTRASLVVARGL